MSVAAVLEKLMFLIQESQWSKCLLKSLKNEQLIISVMFLCWGNIKHGSRGYKIIPKACGSSVQASKEVQK